MKLTLISYVKSKNMTLSLRGDLWTDQSSPFGERDHISTHVIGLICSKLKLYTNEYEA